MYGKSYDGVTGLLGVNQQPSGLEAVVSQEPVYDLYRYLYGDGIRRLNSVLTPALYDLIDLTPGTAQDSPDYNLGGLDDTQRPGCPALNLADQAGNDDHYSDYWRKRNLIPGAKGSDVPLFLTQGLTENNTVADGTAQYLDNHAGPERAWLGPWEHVRGNETDASGRLKMGRAGFFDEVMRFYDQYLKGVAPGGAGPAGRRADQRRQVARRAVLAARRQHGLHDAAAVRHLQRRRLGQRDGLRRRRRLDDLAAAPVRRPLLGRRQGGRRRRHHAAERQPRRRRLRPRRVRHRAADHAPGLPRPLQRREDAGPLVGRLEAAGRAPDRRARDRRQRGLVGPHAAVRRRRRRRRLGHAAVPRRAAHGDDPGRPGHPARGLPRRDVTVPPETMRESVSPGFALPPEQTP